VPRTKESSTQGQGERGVAGQDIDKVFKALADPTRRRLLDLLHGDNGQTLSALCEGMAMTRQGVTQHLQQLEEANLVAVVWQGREKLHYLNPVPLYEIQDRWIGKFERNRLGALRDLKRKLEGNDDEKA
jgi:DNA-binding transcriptional ArsR family regulator